MAIEPVLIVLGSCQCMLAPYTAPALSSQSLTLDYDKSPPHFQVLNSFRTGNIPLAILATSILLSNVLAIAFAGLFSASRLNSNGVTKVHTYPPLVFQEGFIVPALEMYYVLSSFHSGFSTIEPPTWTTPEYFVLRVEPETSNTPDQYKVDTLGIGLNVQCTVIPQHQLSTGCENMNYTVGSCSSIPDLLSYVVTAKNDPCWDFLRPDGSSSTTMRVDWRLRWHVSYDVIAQSTRCLDTFYPVWVERVKEKTGEHVYRIDSLILKCTAVDKVVNLTASIDSKFQVRNYTVMGEYDTSEISSMYPDKSNWTLATTFLASIQAGWEYEESVTPMHNLRWLNYIIKTVEPTTVLNLTDARHIPNEINIAEVFESVYRHLFAINLRLHEDEIIARRKPLQQTLPAKTDVVVDRVKMSPLLFTTAITILVMMIAVLVVIYWGGQEQVISHPPESLAGMYALLYASNAQLECGEMEGNSPEKRARKLKKSGAKYKYGEYPDGVHHGIYRVDDAIVTVVQNSANFI